MIEKPFFSTWLRASSIPIGCEVEMPRSLHQNRHALLGLERLDQPLMLTEPAALPAGLFLSQRTTHLASLDFDLFHRSTVGAQTAGYDGLQPAHFM
jgi:hypothetical protein